MVAALYAARGLPVVAITKVALLALVTSIIAVLATPEARKVQWVAVGLIVGVGIASGWWADEYGGNRPALGLLRPRVTSVRARGIFARTPVTRIRPMKRLTLVVPALALLLVAALPVAAGAPSPAHVELTCSDGTIFTGEQVRTGFGTPPRTFRNVNPGEDPVAFAFFEASVVAPDGTVVEDIAWEHSRAWMSRRTS